MKNYGQKMSILIRLSKKKYISKIAPLVKLSRLHVSLSVNIFSTSNIVLDLLLKANEKKTIFNQHSLEVICSNFARSLSYLKKKNRRINNKKKKTKVIARNHFKFGYQWSFVL